jgi:hypothetical protein
MDVILGAFSTAAEPMPAADGLGAAAMDHEVEADHDLEMEDAPQVCLHACLAACANQIMGQPEHVPISSATHPVHRCMGSPPIVVFDLVHTCMHALFRHWTQRHFLRRLEPLIVTKQRASAL